MGGFGSGGANRKPVDWHLAEGSYRPRATGSRQHDPAPASIGERRVTLRGLGASGRRVVAGLLDVWGGGTPRAWPRCGSTARSFDRLAVLDQAGALDPAALHKELRTNVALSTNVALRKTLGLEHVD